MAGQSARLILAKDKVKFSLVSIYSYSINTRTHWILLPLQLVQEHGASVFKERLDSDSAGQLFWQFDTLGPPSENWVFPIEILDFLRCVCGILDAFWKLVFALVVSPYPEKERHRNEENA